MEGRTKFVERSRKLPEARRNADRRSEARKSVLAAVVKILNAIIDGGIAVGLLGGPVSSWFASL